MHTFRTVLFNTRVNLSTEINQLRWFSASHIFFIQENFDGPLKTSFLRQVMIGQFTSNTYLPYLIKSQLQPWGVQCL